jgi:hypothetical protein
MFVLFNDNMMSIMFSVKSRHCDGSSAIARWLFRPRPDSRSRSRKKRPDTCARSRSSGARPLRSLDVFGLHKSSCAGLRLTRYRKWPASSDPVVCNRGYFTQTGMSVSEADSNFRARIACRAPDRADLRVHPRPQSPDTSLRHRQRSPREPAQMSRTRP